MRTKTVYCRTPVAALRLWALVALESGGGTYHLGGYSPASRPHYDGSTGHIITVER